MCRSIAGAVAAFDKLIKPGGVVLVTVGNRFNPGMLLCEPHYGLPGMTLLPRAFAENYCLLSQHANYDVHHWPTRRELENLFSAKGFVVQPEIIPSRPNVLAELDDAVSALRQTVYPTDVIRREVLSSLEMLEAFRFEIQSPEDFFGLPIITVIAKKRR